jgi:putative transposase
MLCVDGGAGLLAALPTAFPGIPVQRCWAHKIRNILNKVRKPDQPWVKADLHRIMTARTLPAAWSAARRFAERWQELYPKAVACLRNDLDDLLTCFRYADPAARRAVRTTHAIERRFREVRRRTRPMGTFQDRTSMERILFAVFTHENRNQGRRHPLRPDTQLLTSPPRRRLVRSAGRGGARSGARLHRAAVGGGARGRARPRPLPAPPGRQGAPQRPPRARPAHHLRARAAGGAAGTARGCDRRAGVEERAPARLPAPEPARRAADRKRSISPGSTPAGCAGRS